MDNDEMRKKGEWAETAEEGIVPDELGDSDAGPDPQLGSAAVGRTASSDEPATEEGVDLSAGDDADAVRDGGPNRPDDAEPDLRDATGGPRRVDVDSAG
jgi:hypothetical protein